MFKLVDQRYNLDSRKLQLARVRALMNMSEFAYVCGWSCGYQWQLENGRVTTISESTKKVIEEALHQ